MIYTLILFAIRLFKKNTTPINLIDYDIEDSLQPIIPVIEYPVIDYYTNQEELDKLV